MFELPNLPYAYDALAPHMSKDTLTTHHSKHHAGYIKKTNAALEKTKTSAKSLEDVVREAKKNSDRFLFNNAAQAWNHAFFWNSMTPDRTDIPAGAFRDALTQAFGSLEAFRAKFLEIAETHFASGWAWVVADGEGRVKVIDTHDAATALTEGVTPLLVCDVWEHAYYLDHKNDRKAFVETFFDTLANWQFAAAQYEAARGAGAAWAFPPPVSKAA